MKKPIRVLQVVTYMNRGGLETMLMNYYRNIDRSKIQFDFLEHRPGKHDYTDEILSLGGKIFKVPSVNPLNTNNYLTEIDNFFKEHRYDIIHVHLDCMSKYILKYAKKNNVQVRIAHAHSSSQEKDVKYLIKLYSKLGIPKYATNLFACGYKAGKWTFGNRKFDVINNAIDVNQFKFNKEISLSKKEELNLSGKFVIGHIGRFNSVKNHSFLIEIFNEIIKLNNQSVLVLVGEGPLQEEMQKKVDELGLSNSVMFLGLRNDISEILQAMDVLVFPSLFEGVPLTLIEAQASGIPCVVSANVSKEAKITDKFDFVPLKTTTFNWVNEIIKYNNFSREMNSIKKIKNAGYDIIESTLMLEKFYLKSFEESTHEN